MDDNEQLRKELEEIKQELATLKEGSRAYRNLMAEKADYEAKLKGSGAIAQGEGAKAVGQDGMLIEGGLHAGRDVILGGQTNLFQAPREGATPEELRAAYLNHLFESVSQLQLSGIDPKTASDAEARLNLGAVYTALLTLSTDFDETLSKARREELEWWTKHEARRASALEQLNRYNRLVLLGDPGSGKSTFVNFVAMCLAGERLQARDANLAALTAPLPVDNDPDRPRPLRSKDEKPQSQPWEHGALLPVRVVLRDFAARGLPPAGEKASAKTLWDFIVGELEAWALREFEKPLAQELLQKGGLLLLDGLDEVPEADQRRAQIKQAVEGFAASFPKCRVLVTSRTYAYQKQDWRLNGFAESVLAPFSHGQIRNFVERWYAHIAVLRHMHTEDAQGRAELLKRAIFNSDRLMGLAERPLLLTLMASLHAWRGGTLPEKREELYADAVDLLLDWWESPKTVRNARAELVVRQPSLTEFLKVDRQKVRNLLEELAFNAHARQQELTGTADIAEGDLVSGLLRLSQNPDVKLGQLVDYLSLRAGLLIPRGVGVYTFPHRTFQEYLAACYLTDHDYPEKVAELACADFNRWREVALLAGAKAARGTASAIWNLVDALCYAEPAPQAAEKGQWGAHLAGQALVESGSLNNVSERNLPKRERVQKWLVNILETGKLSAIERARAGNTLAALGDPRFDPEHWYLPKEPNFGFIRIPAGKFIMGANDISEDEEPQHELDLTYDYWLAKYPVTEAQYRVFVDASGYKIQAEDNLSSLSTLPVVNVSWYDALAYCEWLTKRLVVIGEQYAKSDDPFWQGLAEGKLQVSLPSEAEWEKAARGADGRVYPWAGAFDPNRANTAETGIGGTSPVGAFPSGISPYGLLDMSGNVWEWTRSLYYHSYPYCLGDGRERLYTEAEYYKSQGEESNGERIVYCLRGGSFAHSLDRARCASRYRFNPDYRNLYRGFRVVVVFSRASR